MDSQLFSKKRKVYKSEYLQNELDLIIAEPKKSDKNELYFFSCDKILSFRNIFNSTKPNTLHTLIIIRQKSITSLNGISELINIRELWVVECLLEDISDLQKCRKLETLYLYSNNISQVPNLSNSPGLKILSLNGNNISCLQDFDSMPNLQELYIAKNQIKEFGNAFLPHSQLSLVNLAGNPLYKLKEIQNLAFITSLRSIVFADPMYGECPLVSLRNYRNIIIHYMCGLTELDYYPISNEERSYVTAFFRSKMMFYNMLCNTYKKNLATAYKERLIESRQRIDKYREEIYWAKLDQLKV